jgi:hypothetical protein
MIAPFDLFRTEADGSVKWLGVCADLDAAKARVIELSLAFHFQPNNRTEVLHQTGWASIRTALKMFRRQGLTYVFPGTRFPGQRASICRIIRSALQIASCVIAD